MTERSEVFHVEKEVKIRRINPENVLSTYVNDMLISHTDGEMFLTFSVIEPVGIMDPEEVEGLEAVDAIARVKLVMTPDFARRVANVITRNLDVRQGETSAKPANRKKS